eukprot:6182154-Pleurochrysis_carterae.AAC.5
MCSSTKVDLKKSAVILPDTISKEYSFLSPPLLEPATCWHCVTCRPPSRGCRLQIMACRPSKRLSVTGDSLTVNPAWACLTFFSFFAASQPILLRHGSAVTFSLCCVSRACPTCQIASNPHSNVAHDTIQAFRKALPQCISCIRHAQAEGGEAFPLDPPAHQCLPKRQNHAVGAQNWGKRKNPRSSHWSENG